MPINIINPTYACSSLTVSLSHLWNFSPPIHSNAYWLVCRTMYWTSEVVKKREKIPRREEGCGTVGPGVSVNGRTFTGYSEDFHLI